jgi:hypothetical protein
MQLLVKRICWVELLPSSHESITYQTNQPTHKTIPPYLNSCNQATLFNNGIRHLLLGPEGQGKEWPCQLAAMNSSPLTADF